MKFIKKIKDFISLDVADKLLFFEAFWFLGVGRMIKSIPFSKTAHFLGEKMVETPFVQNSDHHEALKRISHAIEVVSRHTWWESQCLVMAIAGMKMLERRQIECTLYLGLERDEGGKLNAHAWLRSGPFCITGGGKVEQYAVVAKFAKIPDSR